MACARAITTSWQVVASVTPQTTLWTPSTHTLSSMLGQKQGGWVLRAGPNITEGGNGRAAEAPLINSLWREQGETGSL